MSQKKEHRSDKPANGEKGGDKPRTVSYVVPDGGYGWVVVGCAFIYICLPMGIGSTFGLYYEEWLDYFHEGKVATSLVGSINAGCIPVLGALAGMVLTNLFDTRVVGMIGSIVASIAMLIASFANSVGVLALAYGALAGLGLGLMFNSAYLIVGYYFDKKRPQATAIASSGTGFGTLFALLLRYFIEEYNWRGSLILLGAIIMQTVIFGALMRPLHTASGKVRGCKTKAPSSDCHSNGTAAKAANGEHKNGNGEQSTPHDSNAHMVEVARLLSEKGHQNSAMQHKSALADLLRARKDQLYSDSVFGMSEFSSVLSISCVVAVKTQVTGEGRSMMSVATVETIEQEESKCSQIGRTFRRNFSPGIVKNRYFVLITLGLTLHHMAFFIPYTYIISLTRRYGVPKSEAAYLILAFGLSNFVLKLSIGIVTMFYKKIDQLYIVCASLAVSAAAASLATTCTAYWQYMIVCIIYGGTSPIVTIYVTSMLVKYLGVENLTSSFSMTTLLRGFGTIAGPPLAGKVIEMTGLTESAFYVGTTADILSLICFIVVIMLDRRDPKFQSERAAAAAAKKNKKGRGSLKTMDVPQIIVTSPTVEDLSAKDEA